MTHNPEAGEKGVTLGPWLRIDKADYAEIQAQFRPSSPAVALVGKAEDADAIAAVPELLAVAKAVAEYDQLLRRYNGPLSALCAGDMKSIDDAYDALVRQAVAALKATHHAG